MSDIDKASHYQKLANEYELLARDCEKSAARFENTQIDNSQFKDSANEHRTTSEKYAEKAEQEMVRSELEEIWES